MHEILKQPIIQFVMNLNGTEEDRKQYKEKCKYEISSSKNNNNIDIMSDHSS